MIDIELLASFLTKELSERKKSDREYFDETHKEISELEERVSYHAEFGKFPDDLFEKACPNQTKEEFEYNKETYRQKTKAAWDKAVSATYRIWNKQNYSIEYQNDTQKEYFTFEYPTYGDFEKWFRDNVHPRKISDPNAVLAVLPIIPMKKEGEEYVIDQSQEISPYCELFDSDDVWYFGDYVMLESEQKSEVISKGKKVKEGLIFFVFDEMNIYRLEQYGDKDKYLFESYLFYEHGWEYIPCWKLEGIPSDGIYHSYFMGAVPFLEDAILTDANFRAVKHRLAYPTRWYYSDKCNECSGHGFIEDYEAGRKNTCHVCKGSGKRMTFSPFRDYEIPMPENLVGADTTQLPTPPFGSESPDTTALEFLKKEFNSLIEDGFAAVNIDVTNKVNGQTATETKIDREEFFSLLTKIASELFDLMQNAYDAIGWMRWGNKYQRITVNKPAEFTIRNAESLTSEFKTAMDAKLPSPYLNKVLSENLRVRFSADEQLMKAMEVVSLIDPFVSIDDQTLNLKKSNGLIALWEAVLHDRIYTFIEDELRKDNNFLDKDIEVIKTTLQELAKQKATELTPVRGTAEDILNRI